MGAGASSVPAIKDALKDVSDAQISGIISKLSAETRTKMLLALEATDDIASATLVPLEKLPESFSDIEGTRFAEVLRRGHMAVIKASYFKECLEKGEPFQDRSNIPAEYIYTGEEVLENWKKYGNMFLMILSYSWLSKKHPDPDLYHLKHLVPLLEKMGGFAQHGRLTAAFAECGTAERDTRIAGHRARIARGRRPRCAKRLTRIAKDRRARYASEAKKRYVTSGIN